MALGRFVVTSQVVITPDTAAAVVAGEPDTGGAAGYGSFETVSPGTSGKYGYLPSILTRGMVVVADSTAGATGPQLLYQAIGAGNLRVFVDGQDTVGHAGLTN